jgi:CBS domain-containing protein
MFGYVSALLSEKGRHIYTTSKSASVAEAVREMNDKGVGALLVMEAGRLVGIFTERDVLKRVVDPDRHPATTKVGQVMTRNPMTIELGTSVEDAMQLMTQNRFRHLPVTEDGAVIALVSIGDIMRWVTMSQDDQIKAMSAYITGAAAQ